MFLFYKARIHQNTAVKCMVGFLCFCSIRSGSARGHPDNQWPLFNIQSVATNSSSSDCFAAPLLSLLLFFLFLELASSIPKPARGEYIRFRVGCLPWMPLEMISNVAALRMASAEKVLRAIFLWCCLHESAKKTNARQFPPVWLLFGTYYMKDG